MNTCSLKVPESPISGCSNNYVPPQINEVLYDPTSGKVWDKNKNYIGQGVLKDGILIITPTKNQ